MTRHYAEAAAELWRFPLAGPVGGSGLSTIDVIAVSLADSDGRTGMGFSYVLGGGGAVAQVAAADLLARFVAGQACVPPQALWRWLAGALNRLGRGPGYIAIAAIDVAAWDLHAKALDLPLYGALGGEARAMPVYGSGGFRPDQPPADAVRQALAYVERGCSAVKLRVAGDRADIARLEAVADALPAGIDIMADANERCDLARAQWLAAACADFGVLWLEEPLPASAVAGYAALSPASPVPIATGEHLQGLAELKPYLAARGCSVFQPDLAMMGGITECLRSAQAAEAFDLVVAPHFLPALFVHLAAAVPGARWLEDFPLLEPLFDRPAEMDDNGRLVPPETPGHGLVWAPDARERYLVRD